MTEITIDSTGVFEKMTDADLLKAYNKVCGTADPALTAPREDIIRRMLQVLALKQMDKPRKKPRVKSGRKHERFNLPVKEGPKRSTRPGTRRDIVLGMCRNGTSIEAVMQATGANLKQAYNDIRLLHVDLGYGVREDEHGNIEVYG